MHLKKLKELDLEKFIQREIELCPKCKGTGQYDISERRFDDEAIWKTCEVCEGSGRVIKEHIDVCSYVPYKENQ